MTKKSVKESTIPNFICLRLIINNTLLLINSGKAGMPKSMIVLGAKSSLHDKIKIFELFNAKNFITAALFNLRGRKLI